MNFNKETFQDYLKQKGNTHFSTECDTKASVVERFNRTIKQRLYRALTANTTLRYLDFLQDLVKGYNAAVHRSIGTAPKDINLYNDGKILKRLYGQKLFGKNKKKYKKHKLNVGDKVMLSKVRRAFKKTYLPGRTEEIFIVDRKLKNTVVPAYMTKEYDDTPVKGTFYEEELQKVSGKEDTFFRIEKVLKRKDGKALVSWKGWLAKHNSWIDQKQIYDVKKK